MLQLIQLIKFMTGINDLKNIYFLRRGNRYFVCNSQLKTNHFVELKLDFC